ncbi:TIM barrel protein [Halarcobacter sp.]|uniref:sugar phosphate isomerase/epimerase family protein n=1 Tax=Halarcobacter sp. TaxID=2321133 RepID=UPI0029F509C5|nr:TIM barrel protein [Halarcobacter sp.]
MIYVSSSCVKHKKIKNSVEELAQNGFKNIELSGGTEYYDSFENDLLELKEKYDLNFICHNYFPPPKEHFVLNLASLNDEIYQKSFNHLLKSINLSKRLGAQKFGFHAGFFINIKVKDIGKKISKENIFDKDKAIKRFCDSYKKLEKNTNNLNLYIENNVFSYTNYKTFNKENIFMLTSLNDYEELKSLIDFNLLLDIAHLKVSTRTLELNFEFELKKLLQSSDYIHISDNDSLHDLNYTIKKNSELMKLLKKQNLKNKTFTLEIYDKLHTIKDAYNILQEVIQ